MTCCAEPLVKQNPSHSAAQCLTCGFKWTFTYQGKGRFKSKNPKWGPDWFCKDDYDRGWRFRGYIRHEVIGTRRRGKREEYMVCCPKNDTMFAVSTDDVPDEVYCQDCDREGLFGPMLNRYRERKADGEDV